jgi:ABC-type phosphate/phosphonate transport system substrate-binding protein
MAAMLHAVHPDQGLFETEPIKGTTNQVTLKLDPAKKAKVLQAFIELASAPPPKPRLPRVRPPA